MERIASFCIDHDLLTPGIYLSRQDGDIDTYDLRMRRPNTPPYLENAAMHSFEHLFATFARNSSRKDHVVYFGPMGCRTGFYFLVRDMGRQEAVKLVVETVRQIAAFAGEVPGCTAPECGNYLEHDREGAIREAKAFLAVVDGWDATKLAYPTNQ